MKKIKSLPDKKTLTAQVIPIDSFARFLSYMPNPDEVLRDTGEALEVYRRMKIDPRIKSLLGILKTAVLNYPIRLDGWKAAEKTITFFEENEILKKLYLEAKELLSAVEYGYAVSEVVWREEDGWYIPESLMSRKPERFAFRPDGNLLLKQDGNLVPLDDPYKFLVYSFDPEAENRYGTSILRACYWPWKFKQAGFEFWLMATEKFAVPSILALFESSEGEEKLRERAEYLAGLLSKVQSGSGAALGNVKEAKVLELSGDLSGFKTLIELCDTQIAYAVTGQSLAVQEAQNGTRAQASVHEDMFWEFVKGICRELQPILQKLVDWIVALNFGPDEPTPLVEFDLDEYATWDMVVEAVDRGIPVSRAALYSRFGIPEPDDEEDVFLKPESADAVGPGMDLADSDKKKVPKNPRPVIRLLPRSKKRL